MAYVIGGNSYRAARPPGSGLCVFKYLPNLMKCPTCKKEVTGSDGAELGLLGWKCASCGHPLHDYVKESIRDTSLARTGHRERASQTEQNAPSNMSLPLGIGLFVFGLAMVVGMFYLASQPRSNDIAFSSPKQVATNLKPTTDNTITANQDTRISGVISDNDTRRVIPQAQSEQVRYGEQDGKYSPRIYAPYNRTHAGRLEWLMPRPGDDSSAEFSKQCASEEGCVFFHLTKPGVAHVASGWHALISKDII